MQTYGKGSGFDYTNDAKEYVKDHKFPLVIKASGLAGGKGVVICETLEEAEATIHDFMIRRIHGDAGIRWLSKNFTRI
jgi:phosphoribosylamine--glycine ligase